MPVHQSQFSSTLPAQQSSAAEAEFMTPAEHRAFRAGREYQAPISTREGAAMGRLSWFCWGLMVGFSLLSGMKCTGVLP